MPRGNRPTIKFLVLLDLRRYESILAAHIPAVESSRTDAVGSRAIHDIYAMDSDPVNRVHFHKQHTLNIAKVLEARVFGSAFGFVSGKPRTQQMCSTVRRIPIIRPGETGVLWCRF